ncbi:MAG: hypothetical protein WAU45_07085 [Blastocatellia bacterium]
MKQKHENEEAIIRYLLGDSSEQEETELESRYFDDDAFFEQCLAIEDELIDSYARGELSGHDRERFEKYFLGSPQNYQNLKFSRDLIRVASRQPRPLANAHRKAESWWQSLTAIVQAQHSSVRWLLAAAMLVIVLGGSWLFLQRVREQRTGSGQLAQQQQDEQQQDAQQVTQPKQTDDSQNGSQQARGKDQPVPRANENARQESHGGTIALVLSPDLVRGSDEAQTLALAPGLDAVQLQLDLERDEYGSYHAVLSTAEGDRVLSLPALKSLQTTSGKAVILRLPASILTGTSYIITLRGVTARGEVEDVSEYYLKVKK